MSEGEKVVGENTLYSRILVSKWDKGQVVGGMGEWERGGLFLTCLDLAR